MSRYVILTNIGCNIIKYSRCTYVRALQIVSQSISQTYEIMIAYNHRIAQSYQYRYHNVRYWTYAYRNKSHINKPFRVCSVNQKTFIFGLFFREILGYLAWNSPEYRGNWRFLGWPNVLRILSFVTYLWHIFMTSKWSNNTDDLGVIVMITMITRIVIRMVRIIIITIIIIMMTMAILIIFTINNTVSLSFRRWNSSFNRAYYNRTFGVPLIRFFKIFI